MRRAAMYACGLALVGLGAVPVQAADDPELDGIYIAQGANPDGSVYRGFVQITQRGDSFLVSWSFPESRGGVTALSLSSVGFGILSGHTLAVSYYGAESAGIIVYEVEEDGARLAGRWIVAGDADTVHAETLTKLPARPSQSLKAEPPTAGAPADETPQVEAPATVPPGAEPRRQPPPRWRPTMSSKRAVEL